jgi:hypothetical protein
MLKNVIQSLGLADSTAEEIVEALGQTVVNRVDATPRTYGYIAREFSIEAAEGILIALTAAGLHGAAATYINPGIDLSHASSQAQLTALGAANSEIADFCNILKELGISHTEQWRKSGLDALPTTKEVETALVAIAEWTEVVTFLNEVLNPLLADDATTKAQIKTAVAAWE